MCLCKCTLCICHSCVRTPSDVHMWQSKQERAVRCPFVQNFFSVLKISPEIAYSQVKFDEKLVSVIGELVWAIILELGPNFWSKLFPEPPKIMQWRIQIEQIFTHTYTIFSICPEHPTRRMLANCKQTWLNVFVHICCNTYTWRMRMHMFACVSANTSVKCIRGLLVCSLISKARTWIRL